jgi:hypothetical protein
VGEGGRGQTLENEADGVTFLGLADHTEGIVDVALTVADSTHQSCGKFICGKNFLQNRIVFGNEQLAHGNILLNFYTWFFYDFPKNSIAQLKLFGNFNETFTGIETDYDCIFYYSSGESDKKIVDFISILCII